MRPLLRPLASLTLAAIVAGGPACRRAPSDLIVGTWVESGGARFHFDTTGHYESAEHGAHDNGTWTIEGGSLSLRGPSGVVEATYAVQVGPDEMRFKGSPPSADRVFRRARY